MFNHVTHWKKTKPQKHPPPISDIQNCPIMDVWDWMNDTKTMRQNESCKFQFWQKASKFWHWFVVNIDIFASLMTKGAMTKKCVFKKSDSKKNTHTSKIHFKWFEFDLESGLQQLPLRTTRTFATAHFPLMFSATPLTTTLVELLSGMVSPHLLTGTVTQSVPHLSTTCLMKSMSWSNCKRNTLLFPMTREAFQQPSTPSIKTAAPAMQQFTASPLYKNWHMAWIHWRSTRQKEMALPLSGAARRFASYLCLQR